MSIFGNVGCLLLTLWSQVVEIVIAIFAIKKR